MVALQLDRKSEAHLVNLLMAVVTVDGLTKNVELRRIRQYFHESLGYQDEGLRRIDRLVEEAQEADLEPDALKLARPFLSRPLEERLVIYSACTDIAFADDELVEEEQELLSTLARLFQIDEEQSAHFHQAHGQASQARQQSLDRKIRGQFPIGGTVRFESAEQPLQAFEEEERAQLEVTPEPQFAVAAAALTKTVELMAIHLAQKNGCCNPKDGEWLRLWRGCSEVTPPDPVSLISSQSPLKLNPSGHFELARVLDQREQVEARLFSFLVGSNKPVSVRLVARASKTDPERALQLLSKYVRECPAFISYSYGCGTWFGLAAWGRRGYEETVRQNLGEIRKQLELGGKANLTQLELDVLIEVAKAVKDRSVLEMAS
ncbi:MAG: TerB family tellurite resistance protein [Vulcanimicrobiota bacterium]